MLDVEVVDCLILIIIFPFSWNCWKARMVLSVNLVSKNLRFIISNLVKDYFSKFLIFHLSFWYFGSHPHLSPPFPYLNWSRFETNPCLKELKTNNLIIFTQWIEVGRNSINKCVKKSAEISFVLIGFFKKC